MGVKRLVTDGRRFIVRAYLAGRTEGCDVWIADYTQAQQKAHRLAEEGIWISEWHYVPPSQLLRVELVEETA